MGYEEQKNSIIVILKKYYQYILIDNIIYLFMCICFNKILKKIIWLN